MQENEFEKRVQQKMEEFTLLPKEDVWQKVEARIKKDKQRKPLFWMLAGLVILGGAGAWWYVDNRNETAAAPSFTATGAKEETRNAETSRDTKALKDTVSPKQMESTKVEKEQDKQTAFGTKETGQPKSNYQKPASPRVRAGEVTIEENSSLVSKKVTGKKNLLQYTLLNNNISAGIVKNKTVANKEVSEDLPLHKYYKSAQDLQKDSMQQALALAINKQTPISGTTSTAKDKKVKANKVSNQKQWKIGYTFYGGISNNNDGVRLFSAKSLTSADYFANQSALGSGSPVVSAAPLQYKRRASFGAGGFVKKELSKHVGITMGLDYHYFSASSLVGSKTPSLRTVYDSAQQKQASVDIYYNAGQSSRYINKYHLLQLPVDVGFTLNKNIKKPLVFSLGLSPSLLIASNALYLNRGPNIYYKDKSQFKKFLLFGQSSVLFTAINTTRYSISAGPTVQYDFNSFSKRQTGTNQHLIFTGIKTNIIFK